MAGIYIHIPFCKQACYYCNFHFSTVLKYKESLVEAIGKEIFLRQEELSGQTIETVYFGGGTPSILSHEELLFIFDALQKNFDLSEVKEFTLEANPDDLTPAYLDFLKTTPINRLSIGVQSFFDAHLNLMNRAHNANEAISCIKAAQERGFKEISIDLMYGLPNLSNEEWKENLKQVFELGVPHISAYCLTVEPKTALANFIKNKTIANVNEENALAQFDILLDEIDNHGFEQYEISNFSLPNKYALHNTNYWRGIPYLGIGPGAHSFDGNTRSWNIANNTKYIHGLSLAQRDFTEEELSIDNQYNEFVMTRLRTQWGINIEEIQTKFGSTYATYLKKEIENLQHMQWVEPTQNGIRLTKTGKYFADRAAAMLFK